MISGDITPELRDYAKALAGIIYSVSKKRITITPELLAKAQADPWAFAKIVDEMPDERTAKLRAAPAQPGVDTGSGSGPTTPELRGGDGTGGSGAGGRRRRIRRRADRQGGTGQ